MKEFNIKDIIAQSYLNIDFPAQYVATMNTSGLENVGITDFYKAFCKKNSVKQEINKNVLFTPSLILGYMYTTFLLPQQAFYDNIPENIELDEKEWGVQVDLGKEHKLKYISRRLRNSLSHIHFIIYKNLEFIFWDAKPGITDIKDAEVVYRFSFDNLMFKFIKKWSEFCLKQIQNGG